MQSCFYLVNDAFIGFRTGFWWDGMSWVFVGLFKYIEEHVKQEFCCFNWSSLCNNSNMLRERISGHSKICSGHHKSVDLYLETFICKSWIKFRRLKYHFQSKTHQSSELVFFYPSTQSDDILNALKIILHNHYERYYNKSDQNCKSMFYVSIQSQTHRSQKERNPPVFTIFSRFSHQRPKFRTTESVSHCM